MTAFAFHIYLYSW